MCSVVPDTSRLGLLSRRERGTISTLVMLSSAKHDKVRGRAFAKPALIEGVNHNPVKGRLHKWVQKGLVSCAGQCVTAGAEMTFPQSALITITLLRCLVKAVTNW